MICNLFPWIYFGGMAINVHTCTATSPPSSRALSLILYIATCKVSKNQSNVLKYLTSGLMSWTAKLIPTARSLLIISKLLWSAFLPSIWSLQLMMRRLSLQRAILGAGRWESRQVLVLRRRPGPARGAAHAPGTPETPQPGATKLLPGGPACSSSHLWTGKTRTSVPHLKAGAIAELPLQVWMINQQLNAWMFSYTPGLTKLHALPQLLTYTGVSCKHWDFTKHFSL